MKADLVYQFTLPDQRVLEYQFHFDGERYQLDRETEAPEPWCELEFQQCSHCPYKGSGPKYCPAAAQLSLIVKEVDHLVSYDRIHLKVSSKQRIIEQESSVQESVSSLLGLVLASCGCPHTEFLLPMARFHLPLASAEETLWRSCGNFLLAQHFKSESGSSTELLSDILRRYKNLEVINSALIKRLKSQINSDACPNAIVLLDNYAKHFPHYLANSINQLKPLYASYLTP
jgi:hypothetical protein